MEMYSENTVEDPIDAEAVNVAAVDDREAELLVVEEVMPVIERAANAHVGRLPFDDEPFF